MIFYIFCRRTERKYGTELNDMRSSESGKHCLEDDMSGTYTKVGGLTFFP